MHCRVIGMLVHDWCWLSGRKPDGLEDLLLREEPGMCCHRLRREHERSGDSGLPWKTPESTGCPSSGQNRGLLQFHPGSPGLSPCMFP